MSGNLYAHFDIEANGKSPGTASMLSIGIVFRTADGTQLETFQRNLYPREDRGVEERCMKEFWEKNPEAWAFVNTGRVTPWAAMADLATLLTCLAASHKKIVWVARPAAYDWQWLKAYYDTFAPPGSPPIGFSAQCLSTLWWGFRKSTGLSDEDAQKKWDALGGEAKMTHNPVDDATFQANIWHGLCAEMGIAL